MECPHCGEEISSGNECKKCSRRFVPSEEMEIQYKEFKVSELLDIRMTGTVSRKEGRKGLEPAPGNRDGSGRAGQIERNPAEKKPPIVVFPIIAFIGAVVGFYLLNVLF